ncbi:S-layer homology domain-containing protein [Chungangia koreensis]|uniref:S-layer homology domain-containing protein n=1 Tax=Chungangia koreensis TaxID=752657 RepID=A0ABV8X4C4_9LACT
MVTKHKNWKLLTSAAVLTSAVVAPIAVTAAPTYFRDVPPSHVAYDSIMYLSGKGVINGYADGTFRPAAKVTRGQAAKILATSLQLDLNNVRNPYFRDVPTSHGFYKYIAALHQAGIIDGFSNGNFGVDDPLNRGQMAKILALAYGFDKQPLRSAKFTDVSRNAFYADYLQSLIDHRITFGVTTTRFAPGQLVDRGQMAMFVHRSELATNRNDTVNATISTFDGYSLTTDKGTYDIPSSLRPLFNWQNYNALRNAKISFDQERNTITSITQLELRNSGTASNPVTLYGGNTVLNGNLVIDAEYLNIKDLTVNKNLTFYYGTQSNFTGDTLNIKGTTSISDYNTVSNRTTNYTFNNSTLNTVQLSKANVNFTLSKQSFAQSITFKANAAVRTNDTSRLSEVSVEGTTTEASIYANVSKLSASTTRDVSINGSGTISNFYTLTNRLVTINTVGTVSTLDIPKDGYVQLGSQTYVSNVLLPWNVSIKNVIRNYDSAKYRIERINGSKNPDHTPPYTPPPVYPDINILSASMNTNGVISMGFDQQPTKFIMSSTAPMNSNDYVTNRNLELANLSIRNGSYTKGEAGTYSWNEGRNRYSTDNSIVSGSGDWKTVRFFEDSRFRETVFEFTYRVNNRGFDFFTDFTEDKTTFLNNTTFSVLGTRGSYDSIAGSKIKAPIVSGTVTNEEELLRALSAKLPEINIIRDITLTQKVTANYPNVKIYSTNGASIKVSDKLSYRANEAVITFTENARNAKWQNLKLVGHSNTRGHGVLVYTENMTFDNSEISNFEGFNILSENAASLSLNKVKLANSSNGGMQVYTTRNTTVNLTNVETADNQLGAIQFVANRGNSKITVNGSGNQHNDGYKGEIAPAFWVDGDVNFKLSDMYLYTKIQNKYYHIDNEPEFSYAFSEIKKENNNKPDLNIANNFTTNKPLHINDAVTINGNGKTITINSDKDPSKSVEGLWISSSVIIDNLNFTATDKMKDHLIEVNGKGASLALSNSTLKDSTLAAIYVGSTSNKETNEKLTLKGELAFTNNVLGGVGSVNRAEIDASKANIKYSPSKETDNKIYVEKNQIFKDKRKNPKDRKKNHNDDYIEVEPILWAESLDVEFKLPDKDKYDSYKIYRYKNRKYLTDNNSRATEIIYSK